MVLMEVTLALALLLALGVESVPVEFLQDINWLSNVAQRGGCPQLCHPELCPSAQLLQRCPAGRVRDACGCCWECGNAEGQFCDVDPATGFYGRCGEGLRCRVPPRESSHFLPGVDEEETPKPICMCAKQEVLCATDGKTYENKCQLRNAQRGLAQGESRPVVAHYGPCRSSECILGISARFGDLLGFRRVICEEDLECVLWCVY